MEQLPKIVGQRLQAVSRTETHPDANLLAAFAEKSLVAREQAGILEHLAGCAACREVVAHAQPEEVLERVAVAPASIPAHSRSWFAGASVRWVALAACVLVVSAVVISRTQFTRSETPVASKNQPDVVATEIQPSPNAPPARTSEADVRKLKDQAAAASQIASSTRAKRDADESVLLGKQQSAALDQVAGLPAEKREADSLKTVDRNNSPVATSEAVTVNSAAPVVIAQAQEEAKSSKKEFSADKAMRAPASTNGVAQAQAVPPPPPPPPAANPALADAQRTRGETQSLSTFYKAKDGYAGAGVIGGLARSTVAPRWQLSADGKLIESVDLGKTWQTIQIADKTVFRALCVTGQEVWVGGVQGKLFYSSDAGQQWEQVKPSANGQTLSADITSIEFKDPQRGKVVTADHQTWTTSDGGHAWQLEAR